MANFTLFANTILNIEGGYQNNPNDKGNYNSLGENVGTKYGISGKFYEQVTKVIPSASTIQNITKSQALNMLKTHFWDKMLADRINSQAVAEILVDHAINGGNSSATRIVQETLVYDFFIPIKIDFIMGTKTIDALNNVSNQRELFVSISKRREKYYRNNNQLTFINGWIKRITDIAEKFGINISTKHQNIVGWGLFFLALAGYGYYQFLDKNNNTKKI